jgi:chemotaxis protein MotB
VSERRRRRRRHDPPHPNHERWLVSYADFITLLFAFFTTMYAISTVDARKLSTMVDSMQVAFDSDGRPRLSPDAAPTKAPPPAAAAARTTEQRERELARRLRERLDATAVNVEIDRRGIVVSIREAGSFPTGSAELSAVARQVLAELADTIGGDAAMKLRVEGHTDDVPIQTGRYASNWELSTARATSVVTYLAQQVGIAPERLSAAGYGEFHPRVPNASDDDRARNRRVDIVILNDGTAAAEEPPTAGPPPVRRPLGASPSIPSAP